MPKPLPSHPLMPHQVLELLASRAKERPFLSTTEITDLCRAAYPSYPNITTPVVESVLRYLKSRDYVIQVSGTDLQGLADVGGVPASQSRCSYWKLILPFE